jgi:hypothetical protein
MPDHGTTIQKAFSAYIDAKMLPTHEGESGEHTYTPDAIKSMQLAILDALRADGPLPGEIRDHLAFAFEEICAGIESDLLTPVKRAGGRERPIAKHMQSGAIRYLRWVEDGLISDKHPTATVAGAYGVTDRTVRGWNKAWRGMPTPEISEEFGAEEVTNFMISIGKQYRRFIIKPATNLQSLRLKINR